jgi:AcrR family transcriptional regulator
MSSDAEAGNGVPASAGQATTPRLRRGERREQLLAAAARAFARAGFAATSLDDVAREAGVSRVILYRHFESKADLYRAVLERVQRRLVEATGAPAFTGASIDGLLAAAADDPDGFRLLFRHAAREPEFREEMDRFRAGMVAVAERQLARLIPERAWAHWAARLAPTVAVEAIAAWLDAGQPDRGRAAERVRQAIAGVIRAAGAPETTAPGVDETRS